MSQPTAPSPGPLPIVKPLKLGLIGLDTSHVEVFASIFNDPAHPLHLDGARITAAFPGGSPDFPASADRVPGFTEKLRDRHGVAMLDSPRAVAEAVDAVLLTSVDGRVHLAQFTQIADLRRPTFIDKPLATTSADARAIAREAAARDTPVFSASSLRFAADLRAALGETEAGAIIGADFAGPMALQATQPGFFWYGIHTAEMVFTTLGPGCVGVRAVMTEHHEIAIGRWRDGRLGVVRGNRCGNGLFCGTVHRERGSRWVSSAVGAPAYLGLARAIDAFVRGGEPPVALEDSIELIRFLEAANESRAQDGREVLL